jgi:radical SAM superfamily enzyme YgiQ (UPF0313 family)
MQGNLAYPGINDFCWRSLNSLSQSVIPDYSDYDLYAYLEPSIPLIDSRGCVQSCEFCDVIEKWQRFQYKTAKDIFEEMMHQIAKYRVYHFDFRSSISNGNLREFKKLMSMIAEYNESRFRCEQISWEGSFIVRSSRNQDLWQIMSKTNPILFMGVESLVERVRKNLGKNFTNQDLSWTLEQIEKYKINAKLLLIGGYPTETHQDWAEIKKWFVDNQRYASVLRSIAISTASILPGTQLDRKKENYGIIKQNWDWHNTATNITSQQAKIYRSELADLVRSLGFNLE